MRFGACKGNSAYYTVKVLYFFHCATLTHLLSSFSLITSGTISLYSHSMCTFSPRSQTLRHIGDKKRDGPGSSAPQPLIAALFSHVHIYSLSSVFSFVCVPCSNKSDVLPVHCTTNTQKTLVSRNLISH